MAITRGNPIIDIPGGGGSGAYNPAAPSGMATNTMTQAATTYGTPGKSMTGVFVGFNKPPKGMTPAMQDKLAGDSYAGSGPTPITKQPIMLTPIQLLASFDQFGRKDYLRFRNLLIAAGLVSETADAASVRGAYQSIIYEAIDMQAGGIMMSPMQLVKNLIRKNGLNPAKIGADEDYMASLKETQKPSSQTTTSVYDLTPEDAKATLEAAIQQKLGRAPTAAEIEDFVAAAQTRARNNPTEVTERFIPGKAVGGDAGDQVTVQREGGQVVGSTVTSVNQGFDADNVARMAERRAENAPDYASYQAVSQYFPAFLSALGSTV